MERVPASVQKTTGSSEYTFPSCDFQSFPETNTSLLPLIRLIRLSDCEVDNDIETEDVVLEFVDKKGETFGKQSDNLIEIVNLETNSHGALYYLNYAPNRGIQNSLGRWCCWKEDSDSAPSIEKLLPDELHAVHVESDGGMAYRASWKARRQPKGLAFILCGLGGMQYSSKILGTKLVQDGWAVVYMYTFLGVPDYSLKVKLDGNNPVDSVIELFDSKYCQVIAATKAIRERMELQLPSLSQAPLVLIGISAGALNTPAVYNELKGEVDAVILIAGGANMFDIVQEGAFTNWKFTDENGDKFSRAELADMNEQYLQTPSRDPFFIAQDLPHDNTLIIHAKWDKVVPAVNGDLLYEKAGRPERWIYPSGHLGLFATFEWHADDITAWINSKIN